MQVPHPPASEPGSIARLRFHGSPPEETTCLVNGIGIVKVKGVYGGIVPVRTQVLLADPVLIHGKRRAMNLSHRVYYDC